MLFGRTRSCEARVRYWALWTSYEALVGCAKLQTGEWVLVLAAAGGVGIAAIQIAKGIVDPRRHPFTPHQQTPCPFLSLNL